MRHDTEVIPSSSESPVEVGSSGLGYLGNGPVGKNHFVIEDVVECPAISPADKAYASFN
jgi:hypothetical protein